MEAYNRPNQERNIEKDKHSFLEAVSSISVNEILTTFDESAAKKLLQNLEQNKLLILGEMHGVKENVDVIYTLFKKFGFRRLALEWEPELNQVVNKFLETGEIDFKAIRDSLDGRITAGHFTLLKKLNTEGLLEDLVCFDVGPRDQGWNARDAGMAEGIITNLSGKPMLVVAGNLHTKTETINFEDEPSEQHPMGWHVKREIPTIASGEIDYCAGQYYNYGIRSFNESTIGTQSPGARFYQNNQGLYIFQLPMAQAATVPNTHDRP